MSKFSTLRKRSSSSHVTGEGRGGVAKHVTLPTGEGRGGVCTNRLHLYALLFLLTACSSDPEQLDGERGTARIELSSRSTSGARYRLAGSFEITGPENVTISTSGDEPELTVDLLLGEYDVLLREGWRLSRVEEDGTVTSVLATVITANPQDFAITNLEVTDIVFGFSLTDTDLHPPGWPIGAALRTSALTDTTRQLVWPMAVDNLAVVSYELIQSGGVMGNRVYSIDATTCELDSTGSCVFDVTGLDPSIEYTFTISAYDEAGNQSEVLEHDDCSDGVGCTGDLFDPYAGDCVHRGDDSICDDGLVCNGVETCDSVEDCRPGIPIDCSVTTLCMVGWCEEPTGTCRVGPDNGAPCDAGGGGDSGRCFEGACLTRGCGDGWLEPGPDPAPEECDPGPVFTTGCPDGCESVDFRVSGVDPAADRNGDQYLGEADRAIAELTDGSLVVVSTRDIGTDCGAPDWPADMCGADVMARLVTWGGEPSATTVAVHDDVQGRQTDAVVAPLGDGFLVVWTGDHIPSGSRGNIFARSFDATGSPLRRQTQVNAHEHSFQVTPAIAPTPAGAVVVWQGPLSSTEDAIQLAWLDDRGSPTSDADVIVTRDDFDWLWSPTVAVSSDGATALVAWVHRPGDIWSDDFLAGRLYDVETGDPIGDELLFLYPETAVDLHELTLTSLEAGGFFLAWRLVGPSGAELAGRSVSETGALGPPGLLSTTPLDDSYESPTVTSAADGTLTILWSADTEEAAGETDTRLDILATQLDLTGPSGAPRLLTTDVVLTTTTDDHQSTPQVTTTDANGIGFCFTNEGLVEGDDDPSQVRCRLLPAGWIVE